MQISFMQMPRKLRLSVQRKNQFRKEKSTPAQSLPLLHESHDPELVVSIPLDQVSAMITSIPINHYSEGVAQSLSSLRRRVSATSVLPYGKADVSA